MYTYHQTDYTNIADVYFYNRGNIF